MKIIFSQKKYRYLFLIAIFLVLFFWFIKNPSRDHDLEIYFFSVGQGDAILIRTPAGEDILIDGGPDKSILKKLSSALPFYDKHIDYMILSHAHDDHLFGLVEVARRYEVDYLLRPQLLAKTEAEKIFSNLSSAYEFIILEPQKILLQNSCYLDFIYPSKEDVLVNDLNDSSLVFIFSCSGLRVLFTGDSSARVEKKLLSRGIDFKVDIIKISHHGSDSASSWDFLSASTAKIGVISVGEDNHFNHPSPLILDRLKSLNIDIYRTDIDGDIKILANNSYFDVLLGNRK